VSIVLPAGSKYGLIALSDGLPPAEGDGFAWELDGATW
jgi:hypothetical protein